MPTLELNQIITVDVASLAHGGSGVGRFENFVVFIPYTAPGDIVRARVTELKKQYAQAELVEVLSLSPQRHIPPCPVFGSCGGCQWQHVEYDEQLRQKQNIVGHNLSRIANEEDVPILAIEPSPQDLFYRNRAQFRIQGSRVGFYKRGSHELVEFEKCFILEDALNAEFLKIRNEAKSNHPQKTAKIEVFLDATGHVIRSQNHGHGEELGFSQVNTRQNIKMQAYVCSLFEKPLHVDRDNAGSRGNLLDLYCGSGNFSFPLNALGWRIYGVDLNKAAIRSAREKANQDTFFSGADCGAEIKKLADRNRRFEALLLDPPRVGADERLWANLAKLSPELVVYVSCNPATFARDWARMKAKMDLKLVSIKPFDMFPQTFHVELVALAKRV